MCVWVVDGLVMNFNPGRIDGVFGILVRSYGISLEPIFHIFRTDFTL